VYRANAKDISYTTNFHNQEDYTISLIKSRAPISPVLINKHANLFNYEYAMQKINRQLEKNKEGLVNVDKKVKPLGNDFLQVDNDKMPIFILNSQQKADLYHFKVMELKTHEDTGGASVCRLRFHFFFDIIRTKKREDLSKMAWDINSDPI
jgi:hypothetical protein